MAGEDDRAGLTEFAEEAHALLAEERIANGQGFVDHQDIGVHMGNHGKGQANDHAAGVGFDRLIEEGADVGEGGDLVKAGFRLLAREAQDTGIEQDVFAACEIGVKASAQFQECGDAAGGGDGAGGRGKRAADDLQERGFARAIAADDAQGLAARISRVMSRNAQNSR